MSISEINSFLDEAVMDLAEVWSPEARARAQQTKKDNRDARSPQAMKRRRLKKKNTMGARNKVRRRSAMGGRGGGGGREA